MRLAVVIPCHSRVDLLRRALAAVEGFETWVVDDSNDGLELQAPHVIRTSGSLGFAQAVNLGLAAVEAQGFTHAFVLNDDAVPSPECIDTLVAAWTDNDGALAPVLVDAAGDQSSGFVVRRSGRIRVRKTSVSAPTEVPAVSGAAMLLRSKERFDPGYRHGFEDLELCRRIRARGLKIRVLPVRCAHTGGATISRSSRHAQRAALSGHLRYLGGGWRSGLAVALSVGQVLREGANLERLLGVLDGCRDHLGQSYSSAPS